MALAAVAAGACVAPPAGERPPAGAAAPVVSAASAGPRGEDALSGTVRGADGRPIPGALVAVIPHFELEYAGDPPVVPLSATDAGGRYHFEAIAPGRYGVTATASGVTAAYGGVHVIEPGARLSVDLRLGGEGVAVTGTVRDVAGAPVPGARLQAARMGPNEGEVFVALAGADGRYALSLPVGFEYMLVVDAPPRQRVYKQIAAVSQTADWKLEPPPAPRPADAEIKAFFAGRAIPITTLKPGSGTADLAPLAATIGDARIVAVGEATHGSAEFFFLRHRLLELLVELGFTAVAIEAAWPDVFAVDDYVLHGKGDPVKALAGVRYWAPQTEEMVAILRWMRRYNQDPSHKKKLRFRGFDLQFTDNAVAAVLAYLGKVDPKATAAAGELLAPFRDVMADMSYPALDPAVIAKTTTGVADLVARFDAERAAWIARSSEPAWTTARQHANIIRQAEAAYRQPGARDRAMAENVQWILDHEPPGAKIVLWAHNTHLAAQQTGFSEMGRLLRERHGSAYFVVGTAFGAGSFRALDRSEGRSGRDIEAVTLGPAPAGSLDAALGLAGLPLFAVDMRAAAGPVGAWLGSKTVTRSVGGIFRGDAMSGVWLSPKKSFDALVYLDAVTASHLNPGAR